MSKKKRSHETVPDSDIFAAGQREGDQNIYDTENARANDVISDPGVLGGRVLAGINIDADSYDEPDSYKEGASGLNNLETYENIIEDYLRSNGHNQSIEGSPVEEEASAGLQSDFTGLGDVVDRETGEVDDGEVESTQTKDGLEYEDYTDAEANAKVAKEEYVEFETSSEPEEDSHAVYENRFDQTGSEADLVWDGEDDWYAEGQEDPNWIDCWNNEDPEDFDDNRSELHELEQRFTTYQLPKKIAERYPFIKDLPAGVGVMGGMARSIAREIVTGDNGIESVRDIDLVNILRDDGTSYIDDAVRDQLSEEYMADGYANGHGMGDDTLTGYFATRDFTMNQALIINGQLIVSEAAVSDLRENIIRPSYYEMSRSSDRLSGRLTAKALLMKSASASYTDSVPTLEEIEVGRIHPFDLALTMNKALSRGVEVAHAFTRELAEWGLVPARYANRPMALAKRLREQTYRFDYRAGASQDTTLILPNRESPEMARARAEAAMFNYYSSDPEVREEIDTYRDLDEGIEPPERVRG